MIRSRRRVLVGGLGATVTVLAGCSSFRDGETDDEPSDNSDDDDSSGYEPPDGWPSFQGTAGNTGQTTGLSLPSVPSERWNIPLEGIEKQPAIADGKLYLVTTDGSVHALDTGTGKTEWTESVQKVPVQCPCIVDGLVFVGTDDGAVIALDAESGKREWTVELAGAIAGLTPFDGVVYTGTEAGEVVGLDAVSSDRVFETAASGPVQSNPAVTDDRIYIGRGTVGSGYSVVGFGRSTGDRQFEIKRPGTEAVIATEETVATVGLWNLQVHTSEERLIAQSSATTVPAATQEAVFTGGSVLATLPTYPEGPEWTYPLYEITRETAVRAPITMTDEQLYASYEQPNTTVFALDRASGSELWTYELPDGRTTAAVPADGALFIGIDSGHLLALE